MKVTTLKEHHHNGLVIPAGASFEAHESGIADLIALGVIAPINMVNLPLVAMESSSADGEPAGTGKKPRVKRNPGDGQADDSAPASIDPSQN